MKPTQRPSVHGASSSAASAIEAVAAMRPSDPTKWDSPLQRGLGVLKRTLFCLAGLSLLASIALAVDLHWFGMGAPDEIRQAGRLAAIAAVGLALLAVILDVLAMVAQLVVMVFRAPAVLRADFEQDAAHAQLLSKLPTLVLAEADYWLDLKQKRIERRQHRIIGSSDKLGLLVVIAAGYAAWKEIGALVDFAAPSGVTLGAALAVGLVLGGMAAARQRDHIAYQRELIQLAKRLKEQPACAPAV